MSTVVRKTQRLFALWRVELRRVTGLGSLPDPFFWPLGGCDVLSPHGVGQLLLLSPFPSFSSPPPLLKRLSLKHSLGPLAQIPSQGLNFHPPALTGHRQLSVHSDSSPGRPISSIPVVQWGWLLCFPWFTSSLSSKHSPGAAWVWP